MPHLWARDSAGQWSILPPEGDVFDLRANPPAAASGPPATCASSAALLLRSRRGDPPEWVLVAGAEAGMAVNGLPSLTGIHVLADRAEIRVDSAGTFFFSTETLPAIVKFPGAERRIVCPRCKLAIEAGESAVQCPDCRVWHHQRDDRACFTYDTKCAACGGSSDLNAGYRWTPEEA